MKITLLLEDLLCFCERGEYLTFGSSFGTGKELGFRKVDTIFMLNNYKRKKLPVIIFYKICRSPE